MKKRIITAIFAAAVSVAMSVNVFAGYQADEHKFTSDGAANSSGAGTEAAAAAGSSDATGTKIGTDQDVSIKVKTTSTNDKKNVYAVSYGQTELTFDYTTSSPYIWNPETLKYENVRTGTGTWSESKNITVNNYSDVGITVTPNLGQTLEQNLVNVSVGDAINLASAFDNNISSAGSAKSGTINVSLSGMPRSVYSDYTEIAKVTLAVTKQ